MRSELRDFAARAVDVAIIGGGINGSAAAQELAAAGFSVALVEKEDFGAGSSGRSSRLLHCGLRYFASGRSMTEFLLQPKRLLDTLRTVRRSMQVRSDFVRSQPERVRKIRMLFPVFQDSAYPPWQIALAFRALKTVGPTDVPLEDAWIPGDRCRRELPFVNWLANPQALRGAFRYSEFQLDWPERITMDLALDAERMGAAIRNHTAVTALRREGQGWRLELRDALDGSRATLAAGAVLNTTGIWTDAVNALTGQSLPRKVTGTKGAHIVLRLPPECRDTGFAAINRKGEPLYCMPMGELHFFGPTEMLYEGDLDDVRVTESDFAFLLAEANHLMPGLRLQRQDILWSWAGVRPLTHDPARPKGARTRRLHDMAADGLPGLFGLTNGSIGAHRSTGQALRDAVAAVVRPSGPPQPLSRAAKLFPEMQNSPPLLPDDGRIKLADLRHAAAHEHAATLTDLLARRAGLVWTAGRAVAEAPEAAAAVAPVLGWDAARQAAEVAAYRAAMERLYPAPGHVTA